MYHNRPDQGQNRDLSRRLILTSAVSPSPRAFNIRAGHTWIWLQDLKHKCPSSNLFYINDLKLYSKHDRELVGELKIVKPFSDDIGMEFGLENCAKASFKKGKLASTGNIIIDELTAIEELNQEGVMIQIPGCR